MGKKIIIKGVSFFENAVVKSDRAYMIGVTDAQFNTAGPAWSVAGFGYSLSNQSAIKGKKLHGIRLKVGSIGTTTIYKAKSVNPSSSNTLTEVATITATETGLQDIDFSSPIVLAQNEYLIIGAKEKGQKELAGCSSASFIQPFYYVCGSSNPKLLDTSCLCVDFYTKL